MSLPLARRDGTEASRVRGARFELSGSFGFICSLLCNHATTYSTTPVEPRHTHQIACRDAAFPVTLAGRLPRLTTYEAVSIFGGLRVPLRPGCFAVYASQMLFRHPSTRSGFRQFVGNAVAPAIFNGLANTHARLASYFWLGFITTGLPPDKKRLAWLGAQRLRPATRY